MRPRTLDEVVGHRNLVGPDGSLRRLLDRAAQQGAAPQSLIFWGPPGTGKTTLAQILATSLDLHFVPFSAVTSGIKEVKAVMADAVRLRRAQGRQTLLFVDEIHRFNRAQQDAFLPYVEQGDVVLVGATTENPSFELNGALLSRCRVVVLEPLTVEEVEELLARALEDEERGLGEHGLSARGDGEQAQTARDALTAMASLASGDARRALTLLETVVLDVVSSGGAGESGRAALTPERVHTLAGRRVLLYDKAGEEHFNLASAFHKSLRESDADAAIYWLGRMLAAGEDPLYAARRMVRFASEDIGLADPNALRQALSAWDAYHRLGSPEGDLALTQAAVYLSLAPKSDGIYRAHKAVRRHVEQNPAEPVPKSIRNAPTRLMEDQGYGKGYVYAHGEAEGVGGIDCLPEGLQGTRFYEPTDRGFERRLRERLEELARLKAEVRGRRGGGS